jgi:hypothetical protein
MNAERFTHAPWAIISGLPIILNAICWFLFVVFTIWCWRQSPHASNQASDSSSKQQDRIYKRFGAILLLFGAAGGFLPSLYMIATKGTIWSTNRQQPHHGPDESDPVLSFHIALSVIWAILLALQLWSGGAPKKRVMHRVGGWFAVAVGLLGVAVAGGWVWTYLNDFSTGFTTPRARAGYYTVILGVGGAANAVMLVVHARKRNFSLHKDYALMSLMWTLEPGVHRLYMWLMRWVCWDCWAPENTEGMGIALAKLPANLTVISWALLMAALARRTNGIILWNVSGQFLLFAFGSFSTLDRLYNGQVATAVVSASLLLGATALVSRGVWLRSKAVGMNGD